MRGGRCISRASLLAGQTGVRGVRYMGSKEKGNERSTEEGGRGKGWHSPWGFDDAVQVNVEEIAMPEAEKLAVLLRRDARLPRQFDRLARPRFRRQGRIRTSLGGKEGHPDGTVARVGVLGECGRARVCAWVVEVWRVEGSASDPSRREARMRVHRACSRNAGELTTICVKPGRPWPGCCCAVDGAPVGAESPGSAGVDDAAPSAAAAPGLVHRNWALAAPAAAVGGAATGAASPGLARTMSKSSSSSYSTA